MEYLKELLKKSGWISIVESLIFAIIGIMLVYNPTMIMSIIAYIIGGVIIVAGTIKIIKYVQEKGNSDLYNYELIYGIMAIVIGLVIIIYRSFITQILGIIVGMWIIYSSIVRFSSSLKLKSLNNNLWIYAVAVSIIMFIGGLSIALSSGVIIYEVIGAIMIIYAVLDIAESIVFIKNVDKVK